MKTDHETLDQQALEHLQRLVQRAEQGDASALPQLRKALDEHPEEWQRAGDLALQAQEAWLQLVAGRNLVLHECVRRKLEQLRAELTGENPTALERLLVARVVAGWLQTEYADASYAEMKNPSPAQHAAATRRQASAQHRYLQAVKALATVRKLLRPPVSPVELAMKTVPETRAGRRARQTSPVKGVPVLN